MTPRTTAIVPTLGLSRWLVPCLEALREAGGRELEILLVAQDMSGLKATEEASRRADRTLHLVKNVGFAGANNHALGVAQGSFVATVNDDALVDPGWYRALVEALAANPEVAAVQGVNLRLAAGAGGGRAGEPQLADGCGIAWNRHWQAVQIGHGEPPPAVIEEPREVFGVSATAAIYRRAALQAVSDPKLGDEGLPVFDTRLVSYYEDVDLACRLRAAGHRALLVPAARAEHAGSASGRRLALSGWHLVYGNRHLVLARLLGRAFGSQVGRIWRRDVADLWHALRSGDPGRTAGVTAGWLRAAFLLRHYVHSGAPAVPLAELRGRLSPS